MVKCTLKIDGMMCGMCEAHVNDAIRNAFPKAKKVESSHSKGETTFLNETEVSEADIKKAIEPTGYKLLSFESAPYKRRSLFGGGKSR